MRENAWNAIRSCGFCGISGVCVYTNGGSMQIQRYYAVRGAGGLGKEISLRRRALESESWHNEENGEKDRQKDNKK